MYLSRLINDIETELGRKVLEHSKAFNMSECVRDDSCYLARCKLKAACNMLRELADNVPPEELDPEKQVLIKKLSKLKM